MQQNSSAAKPRQTTYRIAVIAMMTVIAVAFTYIPGFPIIPLVSFIRYEFSDLPIMIAALALGAPTGVLVSALAVGISFLLGVEGGGHWGAIMHFIGIGGSALTAGLIYDRIKTRKGAVIALSASIIVRALLMIPCNLLITPLYTGAPVEAIQALLLPGIIPVNLIMGIISSIITFLLYKRVSRFLR